MNILVSVPEIHTDTLIGWLGELLADNTLSDLDREAFENIYDQLVED